MEELSFQERVFHGDKRISVLFDFEELCIKVVTFNDKGYFTWFIKRVKFTPEQLDDIEMIPLMMQYPKQYRDMFASLKEFYDRQTERDQLNEKLSNNVLNEINHAA